MVPLCPPSAQLLETSATHQLTFYSTFYDSHGAHSFKGRGGVDFFSPRLPKYTNIVGFAGAISKQINEACGLGRAEDLQLQGVKLESPSRPRRRAAPLAQHAKEGS